MRRVLGLENLGEPLPRSAVTIGKFFAVHRGHQALLRATVDAARRQDAAAVAVTFDRHPLEVLRPGTRLPLIAGLDERLDQMEAQGIDVAVVARVTPEFLSQEPEEFIRNVLAGRLGAVEVLASQNFRFGRGARGDLDLLRAFGLECGFRVTAVEPVLEGGERISSSRVAACVEAGRVADAARLLGRPYSLPGEVVRGEQLGRKLGFPTANIVVEPARLLPADGVYVVRARWAGQSVPGAANLGVRPTTDGRKRLLEVHLLDWEGDLYGRRVTVEFLERLRDEQRFPDLEALRAQIARDVQAARSHFAAG
jgi:riboflavin kinase/FMN adenylyltransferase